MSTVMSFDFGLKRIGVAVGNLLIKQAQPLTSNQCGKVRGDRYIDR
jgi:RNase H-fold protein (predicted Holliday junction resolvase)